jgi:phage gp29-like protein
LLPDLRDEQGNRTVTLELLSSGGARQFDTDTIIARYTREIAMSLLQDTILLGHEKVGTQALAREKRDLSDTALQAWLNDIAATINDHAVPRLFALNGEDLECLPRICPGELRPTDVNEFALALKDIAAAGFMVAGDPEVEQFVRRRLGLPAMTDEVHQMMTEDMLNPPEPVVVTPDGEPAPDGEKPQPEKTKKAFLIERDAEGRMERIVTAAHVVERDADGRINKIVDGV